MIDVGTNNEKLLKDPMCKIHLLLKSYLFLNLLLEYECERLIMVFFGVQKMVFFFGIHIM